MRRPGSQFGLGLGIARGLRTAPSAVPVLSLGPDGTFTTDGARSYGTSIQHYAASADLGKMGAGVSRAFAGWFYTPSAFSVYQIPIAKTHHPTVGKKEWQLLINRDGVANARCLLLAVSTDGTTWPSTSITATDFGALAANTWYFFAWRYNAATKELALWVGTTGGTLVKQSMTLAADIFGGAALFRFGADDNGLLWWPSRIDSVAIGSDDFADSEIATLFNDGASTRYADLPADILDRLDAWYDLAEPTGAAIDRHGSNNLTASASAPTAVAGILSGTAYDGSTVEHWTGTGGTAVQATIANRPIYRADGVGGQPSMEATATSRIALQTPVDLGSTWGLSLVGKRSADSLWVPAGDAAGTGAGVWIDATGLLHVTNDDGDEITAPWDGPDGDIALIFSQDADGHVWYEGTGQALAYAGQLGGTFTASQFFRRGSTQTAAGNQLAEVRGYDVSLYG